jgi:tetratricopeptide (TPR) repeat protein
LCDWLIQEANTRVAGLRQRAGVLEHQGEIERAIEDLEAVVSAGVDEPADMHTLGMLYLQEQRDREAELVFAKGIQICVRENAPYYLNSCKLLRAEALLRTGRRDIALTELEALPDGYSAYVYGRGLRTKAALVDEARQKK